VYLIQQKYALYIAHIQGYTQVSERGSMDGGDYDIWDFLQAVCCCVVDCVNQPEVLVAGEGYNMGITTNIYMK